LKAIDTTNKGNKKDLGSTYKKSRQNSIQNNRTHRRRDAENN